LAQALAEIDRPFPSSGEVAAASAGADAARVFFCLAATMAVTFR